MDIYVNYGGKFSPCLDVEDVEKAHGREWGGGVSWERRKSNGEVF